MKRPLFAGRALYSQPEWNLRWLPPLVKLWFLGFLLTGTLSCATSKIVDGSFVQKTKGYSLVIPKDDWEIDNEAWVYEQEFGHVIVKERRSGTVPRNTRRKTDQEEDIEFRPQRPKIYEKLIFDMDIGFQHTARPMKLLVGTISEGDLVKFLKGNFLKTDSDLPDDLLAGYMERILFFLPPEKPALASTKTLAQAGIAQRLEWTEGGQIRVLYGIDLYREYLFVVLRADKKTPESDFKEGLKALDQLLEDVVRLKKS